MKTPAIFLLAALSAYPAFAQQKPAPKSSSAAKSSPASALPANAPSKEQLIRLFDAMEIQKQMSGLVTALADNMEKMMPSPMGNLSDQQKAGMANLNLELFRELMSPEFVDRYVGELIPIYQRHFTKGEVDDLISFYASPVGQKLLHEQATITQESLTQVMPMMQKRIQEVMDQINYEQRLKGIFEQDEKPGKK